MRARYEHLNIEGVTGGVWLPKDGQGDPANIALALAKEGAKVVINERTGTLVAGGRIRLHGSA